MKSKRKATSLAIASVMAFSCLTAGVATLNPVSADDTATVQGFTYNTADFTVTQDYGAYVDGSVFTYPSAAGFVSGGELRKVGSKVRLDAGRNGVLFTSKATGDDAEGKKVTLANQQTGDFTMDFRVFSEQSAVGHAYTEAAKGTKASTYFQNTAVYNDEHNPFQDIRRIDITFTSVSNPDKAFTVYVFGNDTENTWTDCSAMVGVKGDLAQTASYINAYGLCADGCGYECYGKTDGVTAHMLNHRTRLPGTSFTNVSRNSSSMPTSIWFDAENMQVYGKCYIETLNNLGANGATVKEEYRLIRDMTAIPFSNTWGIAKLSAADFEAGYTVDIAVGEMTSNSTPLKKPVWKDTTIDKNNDGTVGKWEYMYDETGLQDTVYTSPYVRASAEEFDVDGDGTVDSNYTYDRYANFIIYDINGEAMDVKDGWTVENTTLTTTSAGKNAGEGPFGYADAWGGPGNSNYDNNVKALAQFGYAPGDVLQGYKFTSKVNNNGAVGEGFSLNVEDFTNASGAFAMKIGAEFDVSKSTTKWNLKTKDAYNADHYLGNMNMEERGLGDYAEAIDQYSDVKEIKITFRSTVDPSKAFNVYLVSRASSSTALAVYTEIEGENYINNNLHRGWATNYDKLFNNGYPYGEAQGTFGSRTLNTWGQTDDTYCFPVIKFDPATMNISGLSSKNVFNYRTLSNEYEIAGVKSATLNASDFYQDGKSTYTVSVSVERMNTKENVGVNKISSFKGSWSTYANNLYADGANGAPTEGWDHQAVIHVYKLYDKTPTTSVNGEVAGNSVFGNEDFGLNFYMDVPYANSVTASMQMEGKAAQEVAGVYDSAKGLWRFTYPVAAKEYQKVVTATITAIDGVAIANGATDTYSLEDYITALTADYGDLANSILTYCESARAYFAKESVEKVVDGVISSADLAGAKMSLTATEEAGETVKMEGATLALESKTVINVYFTATGEVPACSVNGAAVEAQAVAGYEDLYIVKVEVDAKDLGTAQTIVVGGYTLTYSAYSYIEMVVDEAGPALYNVLQALYDYCEQAKAYLN